MTGSEAPPLLQPLGHSHGETHGDAPAQDTRPTPSTTGRTGAAAPQIPAPLSAYEEELLRAYSPTLAGTYERWKGEGEGMPVALAVMMRQWRIRGCPPDRSNDNTHGATASTAAPNGGPNDTPESGPYSGPNGSHTGAPDNLGGSSHDSLASSLRNSFQDSYTGSTDTSNYTDSSDSSHGYSAQHDKAHGGTPAPRAAQSPVQPSTQAYAQSLAQPTSQQTDITAKHAKNGIHCTRSAEAVATTASPLLRESAPKAAKAAKPDKSEKGDKNAQMTLPGVSVPRTPGDTAPMSNYLARTSLFAPIRKGRRVMHDKQMLHSPEGIDVLYTGKQLDMADQDVYLTALRLAGGIKAGDRILINRAAFLRMLGYKHNPGARDYKWLEESFYRIATGRVIIKAKHIEANLPLMGALLSDTRSGDYYFTIPRETYALWAKNLYSYIDLEKRHALERNVPLSKWLQSYAQSHAPGVHTISMDLLHLWCGYGGRLRDFRDSLTGALDELTRVGILTTWSIQDRGKGRQKKVMISWTRERTHRDDTPQPALGEDI